MFDPWIGKIHSTILAWEIPWTEEPGGLQSMQLQESDIATKPPKNFHPNTFIKKLAGNAIIISLIFVCLNYCI